MSVAVITTTNETTLVCPKCNKESGIKSKDLLEVLIQEDIKCPLCGGVIASFRPEMRYNTGGSIGYTGGFRGVGYDEWMD